MRHGSLLITDRITPITNKQHIVLTLRVRSTKDTGSHRDCCIIFNHQDTASFYEMRLHGK